MKLRDCLTIQHTGTKVEIESSGEVNFIEAAANGASSAIPLAANVAANLIAFLSLLAFVDEVCIFSL